ncbi:DUF4382 domain-containing protein [Marinoscillum furvescens]|uniref:Uncharacterized protein DUF4382 n=1 Tax=Marinoscillum furvescens DSM 4134 TaxID=1122208 RepID=A0A3D9KXT1_MARFU|nr:DUF4382 domain-containing protein [Marinoscillum furvescens]RED91904.1 uncharacterized protein DUF4382 [Marinoscillum furvescens DSM 4134]
MKRLEVITRTLLFAGATLLFAACNSEVDVSSTGKAKVGVTDAAIDAENISGVYLKVNEVKAKGAASTKTVATFDTPKTFNILDYQNGSTFDLGEGELAAGPYSELRFILEEGSYVKFKDGSTADLDVPSGTSSGYKIKGAFDIAADATTEVIADIDMRKAFVLTGNGQYKLRPTARMIDASETSTIRGTINNHNQDRVVVYAYAKGTYEQSESAAPSDDEATRFENSINSAVVSNGQFTLAYMPAGEYELIAASYTKNESEETYDFKSATVAEVFIGGNLLDILEVSANADINVLIQADFE